MYSGPLRDEPIAIELHNTLYAAGGAAHDGLAGASAAWLDGLAARLPDGGDGPATGRRRAGRAPRRGARAAARRRRRARRTTPPRSRRSTPRAARAPRSPIAVADGTGAPRAGDGLARRQPRRRRPRRVRRGRDRAAGRPAARPLRACGAPGLRAAVPPGPPAPRVVLERLRQPRAPGAPLPAGARGPEQAGRLWQAPGAWAGRTRNGWLSGGGVRAGTQRRGWRATCRPVAGPDLRRAPSSSRHPETSGGRPSAPADRARRGRADGRRRRGRPPARRGAAGVRDRDRRRDRDVRRSGLAVQQGRRTGLRRPAG